MHLIPLTCPEALTPVTCTEASRPLTYIATLTLVTEKVSGPGQVEQINTLYESHLPITNNNA